MAPQNKREAESSDDICKRIKEDHKDEIQPSKKVVADEANKSIDNNNSINTPVGDESNINATNGSADKKEPVHPTKDKDQMNGAKNGQKVSDSEQATKDTKTEPETTKSDKTPTTEAPESSTAVSSESDKDSESGEILGTLLLCGGANWDMTGRKELPKAAKKPVEANPAARNLWGPHRVCLDNSGKALRVKGIFSGCNACHSVIITDDGVVMTFGRNDKGQLGLGDTETRLTPVAIDKLKGVNIVAAACGRSHTLFLDAEGAVYACGDNKMGQCGTNQQSVQQILNPTKVVFKENKPISKLACGAEFSMIVDTDGKLYSFGHPEHGQLGHNSEGKYFTSGNKYAFHCEYVPRRVVTFISKTREGHISPVDDVEIVDIACGTNHTLAVDSRGRCFSWGFAGYHRLGHSETKNELVPRSIKLFEAPTSSDRGAVRVFAGSSHSMALDVHGVLYFWGQNKSSGEATMYPKVVQDLCGWKITSLSCANRSIFLAAEGACVSWGSSPTYGELGYGEGRAKSSTIPDEVKSLDGVYILHVACGFGHTLLVARDKKPEDQSAIQKLKSWP